MHMDDFKKMLTYVECLQYLLHFALTCVQVIEARKDFVARSPQEPCALKEFRLTQIDFPEWCGSGLCR